MPRGRDLASNLGWKLAAVVLAYFFWLAVVEERVAWSQLEVPVRFENLAPDLALVRDRPASVIVRIQAAEPQIKEIQPPDIEARVDLSGLREGTHRVRLTADSPAIMPKKPGIRVLEVFPSALEVRLEPKKTADVPIVAAVVGTPAKGYAIVEVKVEPSRVRLIGPRSAVEHISEARTKEVTVEGKRESVQQEVFVDVTDPDVRITSEPQARVTVRIEEVIGERTFSELPVAALGAEHEARLSPPACRVTVRGPEMVLAELTREEVVSFVDLDGLEPRREPYALPVRVVFTRDVLRERLKVKEVQPATVTVRLTARRSARTGGAPGN